MLVRMRESSAGPEGCFEAGAIRDLPVETAGRLISRGEAQRVDPEMTPGESIGRETAMSSGPPSNAMQPKARPRKVARGAE